MSGEVVDLTLPAFQDRESGHQDEDKFITAFGGRMCVEAVDSAFPVLSKAGDGPTGPPSGGRRDVTPQRGVQ
ncbi:MAG: hypothetical protein BJ554DRAFT_5372 [Olpidium bornovanus]|uniref:Uncharacterized protein n=1 Tax=Olpidium bornovanus TaxID=278681 RepID=A0A8H7ZZQ1_9FUNG|nr:MAG: hypothetical protein BJ554DRAFT_5372 [Olpidium bornovanus]